MQHICEADFSSLESLGWDFSQLWEDGAGDEKTPEMVEREIKERFFVRITKNETGNFFWQLADRTGRTYGDKQITGDNEKTSNDIDSLAL